MSSYTQHPLSAAFPRMAEAEFQALKDSINAIGLQNPITMFEGQVLDGWHRYQAASDLMLHCPSVELAADVDPRDFVLAQNKARRHVTAAQLATATAAVWAWAPVGRQPENVQFRTGCGIKVDSQESAVTPCKIKTSAELAEIAGVGVRTIEQARAVISQAAPEVVEAVKEGKMGLRKAAAIAKLPQAEQAAAIDKPIIKAAPRAKPEPVPAVEESDELNEMRHAVTDLAAENEQLRDQIAIGAMQGSDVERDAAARTIADLRERVRVLEIEVAALKASRDIYMRESTEKQKQINYWRKQAEAAA